MPDGIVTGKIIDNLDESGINRVLVEFVVQSPVSGKVVETRWCRTVTPDIGMVNIPPIDSEALVGFEENSNEAIVLRAGYNGAEDTTEVYNNDDEENNKKVMWSQNKNSMFIFDDTEGASQICMGSGAGERLDVTKATGVYQTFEADSELPTITEKSGKNTNWTSERSISIKCKNFVLETDNIKAEAGKLALIKAETSASWDNEGVHTFKASKTDINPAADTPEHLPEVPVIPSVHPTSIEGGD